MWLVICSAFAVGVALGARWWYRQRATEGRCVRCAQLAQCPCGLRPWESARCLNIAQDPSIPG
jgi:hypothetical protein